MIKLSDIIERDTKIFVVDVEISSINKYFYSLTILSRGTKEINFYSPVMESADINEIINLIPREAPIGLVINGKGILYKSLTIPNEVNDKYILKQIMPDTNTDEFYLQKYITETNENNSKAIISLARKENIDTIVETFSNIGFVVGLSIGPFILNNIIPLLPPTNHITYKNLIIKILDNNISEYDHQEEKQSYTIKLNEQDTNTSFLPSIALGLTFFTDKVFRFAELYTIPHQYEEYTFKQKGIKIIKYSLLSIFTLLLISYLLFDTFYSKADALRTEMAQKEQICSELETLRNSYNSKSRFLKESGLLKQTKISFHLDKIAETIPSTIVIDEIDVNPLQKNIGQTKTMKFEKDVIIINGSSKDSYIFNQWVKKLKAITSFIDVTIRQYEYKEKENKAYFSIKINI